MGDNNPYLAAISAPTLLIWGREDCFLPVRWALPIAEGIDDCRLVVEPHCGHWVQHERAAFFNDIVAGFLEEN